MAETREVRLSPVEYVRQSEAEYFESDGHWTEGDTIVFRLWDYDDGSKAMGPEMVFTLGAAQETPYHHRYRFPLVGPAYR